MTQNPSPSPNLQLLHVAYSSKDWLSVPYSRILDQGTYWVICRKLFYSSKFSYLKFRFESFWYSTGLVVFVNFFIIKTSKVAFRQKFLMSKSSAVRYLKKEKTSDSFTIIQGHETVTSTPILAVQIWQRHSYTEYCQMDTVNSLLSNRKKDRCYPEPSGRGSGEKSPELWICPAWSYAGDWFENAGQISVRAGSGW